jgi:hypothetical protein
MGVRNVETPSLFFWKLVKNCQNEAFENEKSAVYSSK